MNKGYSDGLVILCVFLFMLMMMHAHESNEARHDLETLKSEIEADNQKESKVLTL